MRASVLHPAAEKDADAGCFWLTFPAQMGQPVRFFAFVQFEIAVRQTCPSGQSHQTFCREWQVTASGVSHHFLRSAIAAAAPRGGF